ncbi:MAG: PilZ domain-containing protein [Woeseiaceae bacterium]|nr:PilZ domain-containing protein [Woeseiaceae bacterium]
MTDGNENRRSFRVSEDVYIKYEILTDEEFAEGLERRKLRCGDNDSAQAALVEVESRLSEAMFLMNGENNALGRCVTLLNDKINIAIEQLPALRENKASLARSAPQCCDVGADGMVFSSERPLSVGDKLHLRFLLSSDNRYVECFARVVRLTDPPDTHDNNLSYGIAVEFDNVPPAQREILIQHMFSRESETLRMRRLELDKANNG